MARESMTLPPRTGPAEEPARVIDLAADFRLKDAAEWETWYGMPHACTEILAEAVYGLPEMNRAQIREALAKASPWQGIGGPITWDGTGQNTRPVARRPFRHCE